MEHRPADFIAFLEFLGVNEVDDVVGSVETFLRARYPLSAVAERFHRYTPLQQTLLSLMAAGVVQVNAKATLELIAKAIGRAVSPSCVRSALTSLPPDVMANPMRDQ